MPHKFKVGQLVDFKPGRRSMPASEGDYKIVRLMPSDGGENFYCVKCAGEPFERRVREAELSTRV